MEHYINIKLPPSWRHANGNLQVPVRDLGHETETALAEVVKNHDLPVEAVDALVRTLNVEILKAEFLDVVREADI